MIEVNRKLYMDEETGTAGPRFTDLQTLLRRVMTSDLFGVLRTDARPSIYSKDELCSQPGLVEYLFDHVSEET